MALKEGPCRPPKRMAPAEARESGYAGERRERRDVQSKIERKVERLRSKNQRLQEVEARGRSWSSFTAFLAAPIAEPRATARGRSEESTVSLREFLRYNTLEFTGEDGEDPQGFLREIEKVIKRLPCSDAKAIELVGMKLKDNAWEWYEQNIEGQLQSENPPTWIEFRQAMMDEFLPQVERERRTT